MLEREYKEFILANGEKQLGVVFKDKKYEILSTFLVIEVTAFEDWIKQAFDKVLSGESEYEEVNGNICGAEINKEMTKIYDNLAEDVMEDCCEVETEELRHLMDEWCEQVRTFHEKH